MSWTLDNGMRRRGRPKKTWRRTYQEDLTRSNITWKENEHTAMDCPLWRQAAAHTDTGVKVKSYIFSGDQDPQSLPGSTPCRSVVFTLSCSHPTKQTKDG